MYEKGEALLPIFDLVRIQFVLVDHYTNQGKMHNQISLKVWALNVFIRNLNFTKFNRSYTCWKGLISGNTPWSIKLFGKYLEKFISVLRHWSCKQHLDIVMSNAIKQHLLNIPTRLPKLRFQTKNYSLMQTPGRNWFHVTKRDKSVHDASKTPFCQPSCASCILAHFHATRGRLRGRVLSSEHAHF